MYWHWHSIHNAIESYWKGILSHNLKENAAYREVCRIGEEFIRHGSQLKNLKKKASVAILLSNESLTGLQWFAIHKDLTYNDIVRWIYDALYQLNIECDMLHSDDIDSFSQYSLLIAPALYSVSDTVIGALRTYVEQGGHLFATFKTAFSDPMLKIYADDQPHGLTDVFGMTYDQFTDAVNVGLKNITFSQPSNPASEESGENNGNADNSVHYWMELLQPSSAKTLAFYKHPHWGAYAAVTHNRFGQGSAAYAGCYFDQSLLKDLLRFLCKEAAVPVPETTFPVIIKRGINDDDKEIIYFLNYSDDVQTVPYHGKDCRLLIRPETMTEESVSDGDNVILPGWDFAVLETVERAE